MRTKRMCRSAFLRFAAYVQKGVGGTKQPRTEALAVAQWLQPVLAATSSWRLQINSLTGVLFYAELITQKTGWTVYVGAFAAHQARIEDWCEVTTFRDIIDW